MLLFLVDWGSIGDYNLTDLDKWSIILILKEWKKGYQ